MANWTLRLIAALLVTLACAQSASAGFTMGQWVLTKYRGGAYYYPGVVAGLQGSDVLTKYDDGDVELRPARDVKPYDWHPGTRVECNYRNAGTWYPGKISAMRGDTGLSISYDDGDFENTVTALCRSR